MGVSSRRSPTKRDQSPGPSVTSDSAVKRARLTSWPSIVTVEGIIGCGKSQMMTSLSEEFSEAEDIVILPEPTHCWESIIYNDKNLLELYYYDPRRYGFSFHLAYFLALERKLYKAMKDHANKRLIIGERSLLTARRVYYEMLGYKYQNVVEYKVYQKLFEKEGVGYLYPNLMLILDVAPEECVGRVSRKSSQDKEMITLKYLKQCRSLLKDIKFIAPSCGFLEFTGSICQEEKMQTIRQLLALQKRQSCDGNEFESEGSKPLVISVEGNIGAGKSTLLDELETTLKNRGISDIRIVRESVDEWTEVNDGASSILELYYQDPAIYAMSFQTLATWTTMKSLQREVREHPEAQIVICERSISSSQHVFAQMLADDGTMDKVEHAVYENIFDDERIKWMLPSVMIHLETDPSTCLARIRQRDRQGEDKISQSYLGKCHDYYEKMWDKINIEPRRIDLEETIEGQKIDWTGEIIRWCTRLKGNREIGEPTHGASGTPGKSPKVEGDNRGQMVTSPSSRVEDVQNDSKTSPDEVELGSAAENHSMTSGSDKEDEESEEENQVLVKIKYDGENHIIRVMETLVDYQWLERESRRLYPTIGDRTLYFTWFTGRKTKGYVVDQADLEEALKEMVDLGRPVFRFEAVVFETPDVLPNREGESKEIDIAGRAEDQDGSSS